MYLNKYMLAGFLSAKKAAEEDLIQFHLCVVNKLELARMLLCKRLILGGGVIEVNSTKNHTR